MLRLAPWAKTVVELRHGGTGVKARGSAFFEVLNSTLPLRGIEPELVKKRLGLCDFCLRNAPVGLSDEAQKRKGGLKELSPHDGHGLGSRQLQCSP